MNKLLHIFVFFVTFMSYSSQGFIENKGQITTPDGKVNKDVLYQFKENGLSITLRENGFSYEIKNINETPEEITRLIKQKNNNFKFHVSSERIDFIFPKLPTSIKSEIEFKDKTQFYLGGKSLNNVSKFKKVTYREVDSGVDIEFIIKEGQFKYNIIVHPHADLNSFYLSVNSQTAPRLSNESLEIPTEFGKINESIPFSYYEEDQNAVNVNYQFKESKLFFKAENRKKNKKLIIDPVPDLIWNTYFGGDQYDQTTGVTVTNSDTIYQVGLTMSSSNISTSGAFQTNYQGDLDTYISKFDMEGNIIWSTYYGGPQTERVYNIVSDDNDNIYVGGVTFSSQGIATPAVHQETLEGADDMFILKLLPNGQRDWCTYHGGNSHDFISTMVHYNDTLFIGGHTVSTNNIASSGSHLETNTANESGHLTLFSTSGNFLWGTFYGENQTSSVDGIAVNNEAIYITGRSNGTSGISTTGTHQETLDGFTNAFIAKFHKNGTRVWGSYFGGMYTDKAKGITIDKDGNPYICGDASSPNQITTPGAYQSTQLSSEQGFIAKFSPLGQRVWGTYTGGTNSDYLSKIISNNNKIIVGGQTLSTDEIASTGVFQETKSGGSDAFIQQFDIYGNYIWGSYFGSISNDYLNSIQMTSNNQLVLAGYTDGGDSDFATTGSYQESFLGGIYDGFLAHFCLPNKAMIEISNGELHSSTSDEYEWFFNNNPMNLFTQSITPTQNGAYYVVTSNNGLCKDTSEIFELTNLGVNTEVKKPVRIYPNPTNDILTIEKKGNFNASLSDLNGRLISNYDGENILVINTAELAKGIYIITVSNVKNTTLFKVVKN
ncbi:MAG: T9SS type A sorting domain-containing protein [Brumimicrobium sp.]